MRSRVSVARFPLKAKFCPSRKFRASKRRSHGRFLPCPNLLPQPKKIRIYKRPKSNPRGTPLNYPLHPAPPTLLLLPNELAAAVAAIAANPLLPPRLPPRPQWLTLTQNLYSLPTKSLRPASWTAALSLVSPSNPRPILPPRD